MRNHGVGLGSILAPFSIISIHRIFFQTQLSDQTTTKNWKKNRCASSEIMMCLQSRMNFPQPKWTRKIREETIAE